MFEDIETRFEAFATQFELLGWVGLVFLLAIVLETLWDFSTGNRKGPGETLANLAIALGNTLLERTTYGLVFVLALIAAEQFSPLSVPLTWWSWILAVILADFSYYWMHRLEHEIRILWSYHSVHHSSPEYNLTTSYRLAWVESLVEWIFFLPMILIGFDAIQTLVAIGVVVQYQTWIHTQKIGKLGWLDRVFNTPSTHRVHHASNRDYLDRNYGGILMLWDRLFGTYQAEEKPIVYGITKPLNSANPLTINFHETWEIVKDVRRSRRLSEVFGYLFRPPGWRPADRRDPPAQ